MTLIISITTPEGIVMASDSRQSQRNVKQITRISTNSAYKLFPLNERIVVGIAGLAFFADENGIQRNVSKYIKDFVKNNDLSSLTVREVSEKLNSFFNVQYPWKKQLDQSTKQLKVDAQREGAEVLSIETFSDFVSFKIKQANGRIEEGQLNIEPINILISGYNLDGRSETYELKSPGDISLKRPAEQYGSTWVGQGDVVSRLILGYDSKILNMPMLQKLRQTTPENEIVNQLHGVEYNIQWGLMTLQDAVDLAVFLIKTTSMIQRYADGVNMDIGEIQGVGGPVDVAVITPDEGVTWVEKKKVYYPEDF